MKYLQVVAVCNPITTLSSVEVADIFRHHWVAREKSSEKDAISTIYSSHGRAVFPETGMRQMLFSEIGLAENEYALVDVADFASWHGGKTPPISLSTEIGVRLREALKSGKKKIHVHLPRFSRFSDLGVGMLLEVADFRINQLKKQFFADGSGSFLENIPDEIVSSAISRFKEITKDVEFTITYSDEQRLLGFNGMAKSWTHYGVSLQDAQNAEQIISKIELQFEKLLGRNLLFGSLKSTSFAGVGGGLGLFFNLLGLQVQQVADFLFAKSEFQARLKNKLANADLLFYLSDQLGAEVPNGLNKYSEIAQQYGIPFVLITEYSGLRKGDLPRFGLSGSYDLWSENFAFSLNFMEIADKSTEKNEEFDFLHAKQCDFLRTASMRCAQTWAW